MQKLSYRAISLLYVPLALSAVLMLTEGPLVNAFLARGPEPELSLAAYGVAMSVVMVVEAPIFMMVQLSIALSKNLRAFRAIRRFYVIMGLGVTALGVALSYTPLCQILLNRVMNIPPTIAAAAVPTLRIFAWWPFPIGWRRIHQGILIRDGRTRVISVATGVRLVALALTMLLGEALNLLPRAPLGALAMLVAVAVEAIVTHSTAQSTIHQRLPAGPSNSEAPTLRYLWLFYLPLATTTVLRQVTRPVISAGIASAPMAELSLAAWPVAVTFTAMFWGPTLGLQQLTIALAEDRVSWQRVSRFALAAGLILTATLAVVSFSPLLGVVLHQLFGLPKQVAQLAAPATRIMVLLPVGYTFHALFTGLLVKQAHTKMVRTAKVVNLVAVGLILFAGLRYSGFSGAVSAAVAMTMATLLEATWLYWRSRSAARTLLSSPNDRTTGQGPQHSGIE